MASMQYFCVIFFIMFCIVLRNEWPLEKLDHYKQVELPKLRFPTDSAMSAPKDFLHENCFIMSNTVHIEVRDDELAHPFSRSAYSQGLFAPVIRLGMGVE